MKKYYSTKELSKIWDISTSRIVKLAKEGKIPGATLIGNSWLIPIDAEKPIDGRTKKAKQINNAKNNEFRFPLLIAGNYFDKENPGFTEEEEKLFLSQKYFENGEFDIARDYSEFLLNSTNLNIKIGAMTTLCLIYLAQYEFKRLDSLLGALRLIFTEDFANKKELDFILMDINSTFGYSSSKNDEKIFDSNYGYSPQALPYICSSSLYYSLSKIIIKKMPIDTTIYDIACSKIEKDGYYFIAQTMHYYLALIKQRLDDIEGTEMHIRKAISIAEKYNLYTTFSIHSTYLSSIFDRILLEFPDEVQEKMSKLRVLMYTNYSKFIETSGKTSLFVKLSKLDYSILYHAIKGLKNREIAIEENIATSTVNKHFADLIRMTGVKNKKELINLYINTLSEFSF